MNVSNKERKANLIYKQQDENMLSSEFSKNSRHFEDRHLNCHSVTS